MIVLVLFFVVGLGLGVLAGIVPGMHTNLISLMVVGFAAMWSGVLPALGFGVMVITVAIVANFFEFVKAMFLNVPDEGSVLAVHPSSKLVAEGRGREVIKLVSIGCLGSLLLSIALFPILVFFVGVVYYGLRPFIPAVLIGISLHLVLKEKMKAKYAAVVFGLSGVMGYFVLNGGMNEPLLPMLTGLFGFGVLLDSFGVKYPKQTEKIVVEVERKSSIVGIVTGFIAASILSFIPAIGPTQASMLSAELKRGGSEKEFLVSVAGVNTADIIFSLMALYAINKPRSGAVAAIQSMLVVDGGVMLVLLFSCMVAGIVGYVMLNLIGGWMCGKIHKVNHKLIAYMVIGLVCMMTLYFDSFVGIVVLATATLIGLYAKRKGIAMSHAMGCLILPTMLYFI